ncbi:MAG TPA: 5'-nucleotidase C-terminal domain-containing protein [Clostridia bacterium]|nr:5'-nucleotidase C-terminal domain-containing protein [Clostridia bacterium]
MSQKIRKQICMFMVFVFLLASFLYAPLNIAQAEGEVITVAEAIANNSGTATVEGYIVAHTSGSKSFDFTAPFANDYNVALADSSTEDDTAKLLSVQLTTAFRAEFGLLSNPGNIGKKILVTGDLLAYNSVPGLKNPTAMEFVGDVEPPEDPEQVSIVDAKAMVGQTVIVKGVVTADNSAIGGGKLSTYIQDETAGINVFAYDPSGYPDLLEGDLIRVTGEIQEYKELTEIVPEIDGIEVLQTGQPLPEVSQITIADLNDAALAEPLEGQLVKVSGYIEEVPAAPAGGGYNISIIDEAFNGTTLRVMEGSLDVSNIQLNDWYEIIGILSQYNTYQLIPRKADDLVPSNPQPEDPSASGEYNSAIASIVDGDTLHLTTPVLGITKVRFVNVDAPETYDYPLATDADISQKEHGEAAKAYLNTLLEAGDEVIIKVGEEATDDYGRLLAQVIRKSDGLNINLEMVEEGYASSYFIWPIGDDYEVYSQAAKTAYDARLGIWNETNPLLELPFVFRAREQGKGLLRYVGNYYTGKYVVPEEWAKIPVEARVFFVSAEEAEANGYAPMGDEVQENIKVQILGANDLHGKIDVTSTVTVRPGVSFGRADYLAAYLRQREADNPNTFIIHSGDMIGGSSPVSALLQDEPTVEIMESIGFDVGTIGNHELDEGIDELLRIVNGGEHENGTDDYDGMNFPLIAANIEYKDSGELVFEPYEIKEVDGVKIGFIGVATTATPANVMPEGIANLVFTDEADAIDKYVSELQAQGIEAIIVIAHVSGEQDGDSVKGVISGIANSISDAVDVVYSGHSHTRVDGLVDSKLIVQAWEYGNAFADIDLEIDPVTKDVVSKSAEIVEVIQGQIEPDNEVAAILEKYEQEVASKVNAEVATSDFPMLKGYPTKGVIGDMALGNFIADGMKYVMNADFALMNGGGVRDNIDAGPVTWGELFNVQPFGNTLVKVDVTGQQLEEILNAMISPSYGPDSFIGGARYTWSTATNKIVNLYDEDGKKLDPDTTYSLVVNNYMYTQTTNKYKLIKIYGQNFEQGPEDITATVEFAKSFTDPIRYEADGRMSTDLTAPVTTYIVPEGAVGEGIYNNQNVRISFAAADTGIGVKNILYRQNGGEWAEGIEAVVAAEGRNVLEFKSIDKVYNEEATQAVIVNIDKTAPIIAAPDRIEIYHYEALETRIEAADSFSGLQKLTVTLDGDPVSAEITAAPLTLALGSHRIDVTAIDRAGNAAIKTITVEVITDTNHLDELLNKGLELKLISDNGIYNGLMAKVEAAQGAADDKTRSNILNALLNQVKAQSGIKIEKGFADLLIGDISSIRNSLK